MTYTFRVILFLCCASATTNLSLHSGAGGTLGVAVDLLDDTVRCTTDVLVFTSGCTSTSSDTPENAQDVTPAGCTQKMYKCNDGYKWLSSGTNRTSDCRDAAWSEIRDKCIDEKVTPRNCSEIQDLGMSASGRYYIFPSGVADARIEVWCDLSTEGGRWTVIAVGVREFVPNDSTEWSSNDEGYFVGTTNLVHLTTWKETRTPVVMEVDLEKKDETPIGTISYSHFLVDDDTSLSSVGTYHGFLGDALCAYVGTKFSSTAMYWGENINDSSIIPSALFGADNKWGPNEDVRIIFRIRSRFRDQEKACPPAIGWNREWKYTELTFHGDRTEGSIISYKCSGDLLMEGYDRPLEERTSEGNMTCSKDATTGKHKWSPEIQLPCSFTCPDKFTKSSDGSSCNYFSTQKVNNILEASHGCSRLNSSLHWPSNAAYFDYGESAIYYTAWDFRSEGDPTSLRGTLSGYHLMELEVNTCVCVVSEDTKVDLRDKKCFGRKNKVNYICTKPEKCPEDFMLPDTKRGCYKWDETAAPTDIFQAAKECNRFASSLPAPVSMNQLEDIVQLVKNSLSAASEEKGIFLGFFNNNNDWSLSGMYADIEDGVISVLGNDSLPYRVLKVDLEGNFEILPSEDTWPRTFDLSNLCELHGPTGCAFEMPSIGHAKPQQSVEYYHEINTNHPYECNRGFFVDGNQSLTVQTITCYGQLGGWSPNLLPCQRVQVCFGKPFEPYPEMTVVQNGETHYLDGTIEYNCQPNMTTRNKGVQQIYQCKENASYLKFPGQPMVSGFNFTASQSDKQELELCNICKWIPNINGHHIKQPDTSIQYEIGEKITLECQDGHHVTFRNKTQTVECLNDGWNTTTVTTCYGACEDDPPATGLNVIMEEMTSDRIDSNVTYECKPGFFIEPTQDHPDLSTTITAICDSNHTWKVERNITEPLDCVKVIQENPPVPGDGASYNWDNFSRTLGTEVIYTCPPESGGFQITKIHTLSLNATETGWKPPMTSDQLKCVKVCRGTPDGPEIKNASALAVIESGNEIALECNDGFHVSFKTKFQTMNCTADGWEPQTPLPCYKACVDDPPDLGETLVLGEVRADEVNSVADYNCTEGLYLAPTQDHRELATTVEAICQSDGQWQIQNPRSDPLECVIVIEKPPIPGNRTVYDWDGYSRTVGTKVTYNCSDSQLFFYNEENSLTIEATPYGWNPNMTSEMLYCYQVCTEDSVPAPGDNMMSDNKTSPENRIEGMAFNYTCNQDTYLLPSEGYPVNTTSTSAVCNDKGEWDFAYPGASLDCFPVCLEDPPEVLNANSDWNNITRKIGTNITYECLQDYFFPGLKTEWTLTCEDSGWTKVDKKKLTCEKGCFEKAPATIHNATLLGSIDLGREGDILHYICPDGTALKSGTNKMTIKCVNESWTESSANISCESACSGPPPPPGSNTRYNFSGDYTEGQVVLYECDLDYFTDGTQTFYTVCQYLEWTIASVPECRKFLI